MTPRAKEIIWSVAARHRLEPHLLLVKCRTKAICLARFEAIYLLRAVQRPNGSPIYSFGRIASIFGRDHSTIINAVRRWPELSGAPPLVYETPTALATRARAARRKAALLEQAAA